VMVVRQLPIVVGACLAGAALKASGVVPVGHPAVLALFAVGLAALLWPPSVAHLGRTAWRASSPASAFRSRLRVLAVAAGVHAVLSAVLIAVVTGLVVATVLV
jgi:hypothetical protein